MAVRETGAVNLTNAVAGKPLITGWHPSDCQLDTS